MSGHFCRRAAQTNEGLAYSRFKQPSHSGDATRPRAAGKSLYRFPESVPCQPAFAYPARGGFGRRDNRKCTETEVASDGAHPTRSRGRASRGGSFRPNARRRHWRRSSTATHGDLADTNFEITHPHHPLRGQKFKLITYRHNWGEDRVYFHNAEGCLSSIPAGWTTVVAPDPFVTVAGGRCLFRYQDLLQLVDLMEKLR